MPIIASPVIEIHFSKPVFEASLLILFDAKLIIHI